MKDTSLPHGVRQQIIELENNKLKKETEPVTPKKVFKVAHIRKFEREVYEGKITSSRMVEIMNEMAFEAYVVIK